MGAQVVGPKKTRQLAERTGLDVKRAWAHGGYYYNFVTADHKHYTYDLKTGEWEPETGRIFHYTSCQEFWPGYRDTE